MRSSWPRGAAAAVLCLPGCPAPWWQGTWTSTELHGAPDTVVTVSCPGMPVQRSPAAVTAVFEGCYSDGFNASLQLDFGGETITCTGGASDADALIQFTRTCTHGWTISGAFMKSAFLAQDAVTMNLNGTAIVGTQSCPMTVTGPLFFAEKQAACVCGDHSLLFGDSSDCGGDQ